jgi:hypothetical protein
VHHAVYLFRGLRGAELLPVAKPVGPPLVL